MASVLGHSPSHNHCSARQGEWGKPGKAGVPGYATRLSFHVFDSEADQEGAKIFPALSFSAPIGSYAHNYIMLSKVL
jgi:hypothetical protein